MENKKLNSSVPLNFSVHKFQFILQRYSVMRHLVYEFLFFEFSFLWNAKLNAAGCSRKLSSDHLITLKRKHNWENWNRCAGRKQPLVTHSRTAYMWIEECWRGLLLCFLFLNHKILHLPPEPLSILWIKQYVARRRAEQRGEEGGGWDGARFHLNCPFFLPAFFSLWL